MQVKKYYCINVLFVNQLCSVLEIKATDNLMILMILIYMALILNVKLKEFDFNLFSCP